MEVTQRAGCSLLPSSVHAKQNKTLQRSSFTSSSARCRRSPRPHTLCSHDEQSESVTLRKNPDLYSTSIPTTPPPSAPQTPPAAFPNRTLRKPEVLSPAGGWPQLRAAVENGADAVYFGVSDFNARARASNFTPDELPAVMIYLHHRGVKGYLVLNVLIFDSELHTVAQRAQQAAAAGVDAVIVQDVGAVELIRAAAPGLPVHGSTQMTITSAEGAAFAASRGVERIVVGRELSIRDIASVSASGVAVEAFVHGALCVSYSGQCFSSEAWGGRSANRGQCAQACRLEYSMLVDGKIELLGDASYLLSPQDLAAVELVPQMIEAGVVSFKIEGRLKGPEYVALTTRAYREAVDKAWAACEAGTAGTSSNSAQTLESAQLDQAAWRDLRQVFARGQDGVHNGLTPGFLLGPAHQQLVRGRGPRHRGVFLGEVKGVSPRGELLVQLAAPLRRGDGVVLDRSYLSRNSNNNNNTAASNSSSPSMGAYRNRSKKEKGNTILNTSEDEMGGFVYGIRQRTSSSASPGQQQGRKAPKNSPTDDVLEASEGALVEIELGGPVDTRGVAKGDLLWKNKDPALEARIRSTYENLSSAQRRRLPVTVHIEARIGKPLKVVITDKDGRCGIGQTSAIGEVASGRPLDAAGVEKAIGKHLGDEGALEVAHFDFTNCDFSAAGMFYPVASIKEARRQAVCELLVQQAAGPTANAPAPSISATDALRGLLNAIDEEGLRWRETHAQAQHGTAEIPALRVLCRTKAQVTAAAAVPWLQEIVLDFLEVHGLKEACEEVRAAGKRVVVAAPRIIKPEERRLWVFYLKLGADALLIRGAGLLHHFAELGGAGAVVHEAGGSIIPRLEGDFSLNASNALSADLLLRSGLDRLAPTHDCDASQLADLGNSLGPRGRQLEAILHTNLPIFHTEHCVFARFLSQGDSYLDCGHPCERHAVHLRGTDGADHLVLADAGCRNTVFSSSAQSGLPYLYELIGAGYGCFRVELVDQPAAVIAPLLEGYKTALEDAFAATRGRGGNDSEAQERQQALWNWMQGLPDANGRAQGVGIGSLEVRTERPVESMKPTAAALRAAARNQR